MGEGYRAGRDIAKSSDYAKYKAENPDSLDLVGEEVTSAPVLEEESVEQPPSVVMSPEEEKEQEILQLAAKIEIVTEQIAAQGRNFIKGQENVLNLLKKSNAELINDDLSIFSRGFPVHLRTNIVRTAKGRPDYKDYIEGILKKLKDYLTLLKSNEK